MLARAEAEFFGAGTGDDELFAIDEDLDVGVIDFDDERAVAADDANDRGGDVGHAGGFGQAQTGAQAAARPRPQSASGGVQPTR